MWLFAEMKSTNLKEILRSELSKEEMSILVRGFDVIGDVAIITVPDELLHKEALIGKVLLEAMPHIRLVARRTGNYSGEFRLLPIKKISGTGDFITRHKEYGVNLHLDVSKVYYSPRSGTERYRVARQVCPGEDVLVMFSGIAPLPLLIERYSKAGKITAIEKNPVACVYALKNCEANAKRQNITLLDGDVREVLACHIKKYDRIAMPLPQSGESYLDLAFSVLAENGFLHFYDFQHRGEFHHAAEKVIERGNHLGRKVELAGIHKCGHVSPGKYRLCVDARVV